MNEYEEIKRISDPKDDSTLNSYLTDGWVLIGLSQRRISGYNDNEFTDYTDYILGRKASDD